MKKLFAAAGPMLAIMLSLAVSQARAADLVETAATSGTLKSFLAAVRATGFTDTLKSTGPYTIFAPSDEAFSKLPPGTMDALLKDKTKLAQMLAHHIIPGRLEVADVKPGKVKTLEGDMLTLASDNGMVTVDNASVTLSDIQADNGIIHEIDTVVLDQK